MIANWKIYDCGGTPHEALEGTTQFGTLIHRGEQEAVLVIANKMLCGWYDKKHNIFREDSADEYYLCAKADHIFDDSKYVEVR